MAIDPRDYQVECVDAIEERLKECRSTLAVLPTGTGKTIMFGTAIAQRPGRALIVAHREELIFQAKDKMQRIMPDEQISIEMGEWSALGSSGGLLGNPKAVCASVQTLHDDRIKKFDPGWFDFLVVDEAHHAARHNKTYTRVIDHFSQNDKLRILGVTATPDRSDEMALGQVFSSVACNYELNQAIDDGWLVKLRQQMVSVEDLDFSNIATYMGDLSAGQLDELMAEEKVCHKVVSPTLDIVDDKKCLVFTAGVAQAHKMAEIFNRWKPGSAVALDGKTEKPERRIELKRFAAGEFQFLIGCGLFLEGFDEPTIEVIVQARPTASRSLAAQIVGRGTRILPNVIEGVENGEFWRLPTADERKAAIANSAKPELTVIDFVGNAGRHKLCYTGDILGGKYADEVVELAETWCKKAGEQGRSVPIDDALKLAKERIEEQKKLARRKVMAQAKYAVKPINPFDVFDLSTKREPGWHKGRRPSDNQMKALRKMGVPIQGHQGEWWIGDEKKPKREWSKLTFWKASQLIETFRERREKNLCSFKQAALLAKFFEPTDVSFTEASRIIDEIAKNGWQPRSSVVEERVDAARPTNSRSTVK